MKTTRRQFLQHTAAAGMAATTSPAWFVLSRRDRVKGAPTLVVIYLRGGADMLNMVVPHRDSRYYAVRPTIGIRKEDGLIDLDGTFGLHPGLAALVPFFKNGSMTPVLNVGSHHPTRSHFDAQDFMERGAPGLRTVHTGWLNRYLQATRGKDETSAFRAVGLQGLLPRSLRGEFPVLAVPNNADRRRGEKTLDMFDDFYAESPESSEVVDSGRNTIDALRKFQEIVGTRSGRSRSRSNGASSLARGLQSIAKVINADAGLEIAGIDYNGWDHHANQGGASGTQHDMMETLAKGLATFAADIGDRMDHTMVLTMTEFGRTVRENGNNGTDHGHGGGMFILGGGVEGGKVAGRWSGLDDETLYQGRDLPVTTDFRDVMAGSLKHLFDFKAPGDFFPGHAPTRTGIF